MMLDKKQDRMSFLFELKMGCKTAGTTCNINNSFGPGSASERTVQWWFNKFSEGDECFEDAEHSGWPLEYDSDQLRRSWKLILLQLGDVAKGCRPLYDSSAFEANWKGEKAQ